MKLRLRTVTKFVIICTMIIGVFIKIPISARADGLAYIDENDNICIKTDDKKKTSNISYYTDGVIITRCDGYKSIHPSNEWFETEFDIEEPREENGHIYTVWKIPYNKLLTLARNEDPAWAQELKEAHDNPGKSIFVKLDAIMYIKDGRDTPERTYGPYINAPGVFGGDGKKESGINELEKLIHTAFGWAYPKGITSHYNQYLSVGGIIKTPPISTDTRIVDGTVTKITPEFAMGNWSDTFNLGAGIPSSETVKSKYDVDKWYGYTDIYARVVSKKYTHSITYNWTETKTEPAHWGYDEDGKRIWIEEEEVEDPKSYTKNFEYTAYMAYEYIMNPSFYGLASVEISNDCFESNIVSNDLYTPSIDCISSNEYKQLKNVSTAIDWTPNDSKHVKFLTALNYKTTQDITAGTLQSWIDDDGDKIKGQIYQHCSSNNDKLVITDDNAEYIILDSTPKTGCVFSSTQLTYTQCTVSASADYGYGKNAKIETINPANSSKSLSKRIPDQTPNGSYGTSMDVYYHRVLPKDGSPESFGADESTIEPAHVISGYEGNEPIKVHTPIVGKVTIQDLNSGTPTTLDGNTQLIAPASAKQLRLDSYYNIHWDLDINHSGVYGGADEGGHNKFDKYVKSKALKFPFEVVYNGTLYPLQADGTTGWIEMVKPTDLDDTSLNNHWLNSPIYIPSYATETNGAKNFEYKVEAINVKTDDGDDHSGDDQEDKNSGIDKYVAKKAELVQLSGYVYDFTITGSTNAEAYSGTKSVGYNIVAFADDGNEKKPGTRNRIQKDGVRKLKDGEYVAGWSDVNTLVLTNGKSNKQSGMGIVYKGQTISFALKTMSNLWNDTDSIEIVPHFYYVDKNGKRTDHIEVYYHNEKGSGLFIKAGSARDISDSRNLLSTKIGDTMQKGAYYNYTSADRPAGTYGDWINFTATNRTPAVSMPKLLNTQVPSYSLGKINLNSQLKLYSGEFEQLRDNLNEDDYRAYKKYSSDWFNENKFRKSMQTWYGQYYIPADLFVVNTDKHGTNLSKAKLTDRTGKYFEKEGYLIINFDITVKKAGTSYMKYQSAQNMWETEGFIKAPGTNDPLHGKPYFTEYLTGDCIVVDLNKSVKDKYSAGIHKIN